LWEDVVTRRPKTVLGKVDHGAGWLLPAYFVLRATHDCVGSLLLSWDLAAVHFLDTVSVSFFDFDLTCGAEGDRWFLLLVAEPWLWSDQITRRELNLSSRRNGEKVDYQLLTLADTLSPRYR